MVTSINLTSGLRHYKNCPYSCRVKLANKLIENNLYQSKDTEKCLFSVNSDILHMMYLFIQDIAQYKPYD